LWQLPAVQWQHLARLGCCPMSTMPASKFLTAPWSAAAAAGEPGADVMFAAGPPWPGLRLAFAALACTAATSAAWLASRERHFQGCTPCRPESRDTSWQHKPVKSVRSMGSSTGPNAYHLHHASASIAAARAAGTDPGAGSREQVSRASPGDSVGIGATGTDVAPAAMLLARTYSGPALSSAGTELQPGSSGLQRVSCAPSGGDSNAHGGSGFLAAATPADFVDDGSPGFPVAPSTQT
jgi:hypothetical protein